MDRPKRPKTTNPSGSQANSTRVSVSSASVTQHPGPGNDEDSAEPTASGEYIGAILSSTTTQPLAQPASDWKATAKVGPTVRLESTSHQGSSMFNNINNVDISGGMFTIENHMVSTVGSLACDCTPID